MQRNQIDRIAKQDAQYKQALFNEDPINFKKFENAH